MASDMKRFALILVLLLCPALCVAQSASAPMPQSAAVLVKPTGLVTPITANSAARVRALSESETVTSDDIIRFNGSGTYDFDADPPSSTPRYIGTGAGVTVWIIDGDSTDHGDLIERCRDLSIQFNDKTLPLGLHVDSSGNLVSKLLLRSGTASEIDEIVLDVGEPAWKTDTYQLVVGDGSTAGGRLVGPSLGAAILAKADGIRSFVYLAAEDSGDARGEAIERAVADASTGDTVIVPSGISANIQSAINKANTTFINWGTLIGDPINMDSAGVFRFGNYGSVAATGDAVSVSHASATLYLVGTGSYSSSFGSAVSVSNGSVTIFGGSFGASFGAAINRSGGTLTVYPFVSGSTSGTITRPANSFFNQTPGTAFLSLIDDASAADIRNTAGATSGIFPASAGGTGLGSYTQGDLLYYNSGTTLSKLAKSTTAGHVLKNSGTNNNPAWGQVAVGELSGLGTGVATALGVNVGSAGAPVLFNGAGGTPSSITLTNGTGLPLSSGVTGVLPSANGGAGTVNGILKANGSGTTSAAVAGTDYVAPSTVGSSTSSGNVTVTYTASQRHYILTLGGNHQISLTSLSANDSQRVILEVVQDGSGGRVPTWGGSNIKWPGGVAPVLSTAIGARDILEFTWNGSNFALTNFLADVK